MRRWPNMRRRRKACNVCMYNVKGEAVRNAYRGVAQGPGCVALACKKGHRINPSSLAQKGKYSSC